jgi:hypothetical protein
MILPVGILLIILGTSAFFYARALLLTQWREASILRLQRAAHEVDMRIEGIKNWIRMFHESSGAQYSEAFHQWVLERLARQEGVTDVHVTWAKGEDGSLTTDDTAPLRRLGRAWNERGLAAANASLSQRPGSGDHSAAIRCERRTWHRQFYFRSQR